MRSMSTSWENWNNNGYYIVWDENVCLLERSWRRMKEKQETGYNWKNNIKYLGKSLISIYYTQGSYENNRIFGSCYCQIHIRCVPLKCKTIMCIFSFFSFVEVHFFQYLYPWNQITYAVRKTNYFFKHNNALVLYSSIN